MPVASGSSHMNVGTTERVVSTFAGTFLMSRGLRQLFRHPISALITTATGGALLYRGLTGYCAVNNAIGRDSSDQETARPLVIRETIVVNKPRNEVFAIWDHLDNLPLFMQHLQTVERLSDNRSHWVAKALPNFGTIDWYAITTDREEGQLLRWRSVPGSKVDNAGEVYFRESQNNGTEITASISYIAPAGDAGRLVAQMLNGVFEQMVHADLRRFKEMLESGKFTSMPTDGMNTFNSRQTEAPISL